MLEFNLYALVKTKTSFLNSYLSNDELEQECHKFNAIQKNIIHQTAFRYIDTFLPEIKTTSDWSLVREYSFILPNFLFVSIPLEDEAISIILITKTHMELPEWQYH